MQYQKLAVPVAVLMLFVAGQTYAADAATKEDHPMHEMMMNADTNHDGKISQDEFRAAHEKRIDEMFKRMDTNGDGFIDEAEKKAMHEKMRARREHRGDMHEKTEADKPK